MVGLHGESGMRRKVGDYGVDISVVTALKKLAGRDASRSRVRVMFGGLDVQIGKSVITVGEFQMKIAVWIKWQIVKISGGLVPVLGKFNQQSAKVRYYQ